MIYFRTKFNISSTDEDLIQPSRELIAAFAGDCGYESFVDTDEGVDGYIQREFYNENDVKECFLNFPVDGVCISFSTEPVEDQDWNETWETEEGFEPIEISNRMIIYDALHTDPNTLGNGHEIEIGIRARNAFGTGTHETTRMILSRILKLSIAGKRVLDCGCGTGILGIAALKCGAKDVVAYDIDEWSVENTKCNALLNGVGDSITVYEGDANVLSHVNGTFDVVLANINRNILLNDMHAFKKMMLPGSILVISGFYEDDVPLLESKAKEFELEIVDKRSDADWRCLVFRCS